MIARRVKNSKYNYRIPLNPEENLVRKSHGNCAAKLLAVNWKLLRRVLKSDECLGDCRKKFVT
jgi:hypothetical protein